MTSVTRALGPPVTPQTAMQHRWLQFPSSRRCIMTAEAIERRDLGRKSRRSPEVKHRVAARATSQQVGASCLGAPSGSWLAPAVRAWPSVNEASSSTSQAWSIDIYRQLETVNYTRHTRSSRDQRALPTCEPRVHSLAQQLVAPSCVPDGALIGAVRPQSLASIVFRRSTARDT